MAKPQKEYKGRPRDHDYPSDADISTWTDRGHPDSKTHRGPMDALDPDRPTGAQTSGKPMYNKPGVKWLSKEREEKK